MITKCPEAKSYYDKMLFRRYLTIGEMLEEQDHKYKYRQQCWNAFIKEWPELPLSAKVQLWAMEDVGVLWDSQKAILMN